MKTYSMNQLERYPVYLKYFKELQEKGEETISSPRIAAKLGDFFAQRIACKRAGRDYNAPVGYFRHFAVPGLNILV